MVRELPGRISPTRVADVRPRVSGIIVKRMFSQGSEVKAGDPLYQIDPRPFEVEVQSNEAALAKAKAVLEQAIAARPPHCDADQSEGRARGRERKGDRVAAPGRGRCRGPQGRRRARQAQSRLRDHPRADRRRGRRCFGQRGRAGGAERDRRACDDPAARSDLCRLHPVGHRTQSTAPRLRNRRSRPHRARRVEGEAGARRRLGLSAAGKPAVFRSQGRCPYRAGDACAANSRIRSANCCRACMSASRSSRASTAMRSRCRSRRSSATAAAAARCSWSRPTIVSRSSRCASARCRTANGSSPTA